VRSVASSILVQAVDENIAEAIHKILRDVVSDMPDRIIAVTALFLGLPLVTRDRRFQAAGIRTMVAEHGSRRRVPRRFDRQTSLDEKNNEGQNKSRKASPQRGGVSYTGGGGWLDRAKHQRRAQHAVPLRGETARGVPDSIRAMRGPSQNRARSAAIRLVAARALFSCGEGLVVRAQAGVSVPLG